MSKGFDNRIANVFPTSPTSGDEFTRSNLNMDFYYDGTRWLSKEIFTKTLRWSPQPNYIVQQNISQTFTTRGGGPDNASGNDIWLLSCRSQFIIALGGSALSGSHSWEGKWYKHDSSLTATQLGGSSVLINSGSSGQLRTDDVQVNAVWNVGTYPWISSTWIKTGTPGDLHTLEEIRYRLVAT